MNPWETEKEDVPEYKAKAHLVLEGSEDPGNTWGAVKDCHGNINMIPKDAEVVGTWARYNTGEYWVSLETPIQALQDKATLLIAEMAEKRRQQELTRAPSPARTSRTKAPKVAVPDEPELLSTLDDLRNKLKRAS